ncbi:hypothetical protein D3C75_780540 [compost metagenome]
MAVHFLIEHTEFILTGVLGGIQRCVRRLHERRTVCPVQRSYTDADTRCNIQLIALNTVSFLHFPQDMLRFLPGIVHGADRQGNQKFIPAQPEDFALGANYTP